MKSKKLMEKFRENQVIDEHAQEVGKKLFLDFDECACQCKVAAQSIN